MILEGIVTTQNADGSTNVAPMGPIVDAMPPARVILRPFQTSTSYANLMRTRVGVLHVTDDVELIARGAIGQIVAPLPLRPATAIDGAILTDACRWYELRVVEIDDRPPRAEMIAEVVASGTQREFFGFNRAKHAVVEAAILATRIGVLPADEIRADLRRLAPAIEKTGGPQERRAWELLVRYVDERM